MQLSEHLALAEVNEAKRSKRERRYFFIIKLN